jgi:hypothetical protein
LTMSNASASPIATMTMAEISIMLCRPDQALSRTTPSMMLATSSQLSVALSTCS